VLPSVARNLREKEPRTNISLNRALLAGAVVVVGFIDKPPTANLADPVENSQFPPR